MSTPPTTLTERLQLLKSQTVRSSLKKILLAGLFGLALGLSSLQAAPSWTDVIAASAPAYWYRFEESSETDPALNQGSATGWNGIYGFEITAADNLGKPSALSVLGNAIEFTGPEAGVGTGKFVDLSANGLDPDGNPIPDPNLGIPELTNFRPPAVDKSTTVEYWIKTTQRGSSAEQTWTSPSLLAHESGGDGDMYWGWITVTGDFGFSTSDIAEIYSGRDANKQVTDGQWHHIVLAKIWNQTTPSVSRMYLDGGALGGGQTFDVLTASGATSQQDDDGGIRYLGFTQSGGSGDLQFIGEIDEVAIYTKPFNEAMARVHYLASRFPSATFRIIRVTRDPANRDVSITWQSTLGAKYKVRRATAVTGPFADIGQVTATDGLATFKDTNRPATAGTWFYRVARE